MNLYSINFMNNIKTSFRGFPVQTKVVSPCDIRKQNRAKSQHLEHTSLVSARQHKHTHTLILIEFACCSGLIKNELNAKGLYLI